MAWIDKSGSQQERDRHQRHRDDCDRAQVVGEAHEKRPPTAPATAFTEPANAACGRVKFSASNTSGVQVARKNTAIELAI